MSFETEPLILEPIGWRGSSLQLPDGTLLLVSDIAQPDLQPGEFQIALQRFCATFSHFPTPPSLQQLVLRLRDTHQATRLIAIQRVIEFLCDHRLIKNNSAYRHVDLLRREFRWRRSFLSEPFLDLPIAKWRAGHSLQGFTRFLLLLLIAGAPWLLWRQIQLVITDVHLTMAAPESWLLPALLALFVARSIRSTFQFFFLRGLTGQTQTLKLELTPIGPVLNTTSLEQVEKRTWWEGAATSLSLAAMPLTVSIVHSDAPFIVASFATIAMLIETCPFVGSPLTECLRHFYSLNEGGHRSREQRAMNWITVATMLWIFSAGYVSVKIFFAFYQPIEFKSIGFVFGCAVFLWLPVTIAISWLEDIFDGIVFGLQSDRSLVRQRLRLRTRKAEDRPRHTAKEFSNQELWKTLPLVRQLTPELREMVLLNAKLKTIPEGKRICRQGESKRDLFILLSGQAAVIKRQPSAKSLTVAVLEENSVFGEAGYFMAIPRTADVIALEECVVLCLPCNPNSINTDAHRFSDLQKRIWFLQALQLNPMFRELPLEAVDSLLLQGRTVQFNAKTRLVQEGELARCCYFIIQGKARVTIGRDEINSACAGDVIGEVALFTKDSKRTATVIAETELLAVEIDADKFWEMISRHLAFGLTMERLAIRRLQKAHSHAA